MGKLSVLGAQRVKSLIEILNAKRDKEIHDYTSSLPTKEEIQKTIQIQYEPLIAEKKQKCEELVVKLLDTANELKELDGTYYIINRYVNTNTSIIHQLINKEFNERQIHINQIKAAYKYKEQMLWLCETLEEAKQIVGIQ